MAQPPRGMIPGKRGPNKRPEEYEAERQRKLEDLRKKRKEITSNQAVMKIGGSRSPEAKQLQSLIQDIGAEVIDPVQGWTRIDLVVRKLYQEASQGKVQAIDLLFNRGWGRVALPMRINVQAEMSKALDESGLSLEEAQDDPLLRFLLGAGDQIVENLSGTDTGPDNAAEPTDARSED